MLRPPADGYPFDHTSIIATLNKLFGPFDPLTNRDRNAPDLLGCLKLQTPSNYGPRILTGHFEPGFKIDHFVKDLGIALAEARRMKLSLPGTARVLTAPGRRACRGNGATRSIDARRRRLAGDRP